MKYNVYFEKSKGAYWVLSNGPHSFKSDIFDTRPLATDDLETFIDSAESPVFVENSNDPSSAISNTPRALVFTFEPVDNKWRWDAWILVDGKYSKIASHPKLNSDTLDEAYRIAEHMCIAITTAPILDHAGIKIAGSFFSESFAEKHGIGDIHPSSEYFK